MRPDRSGRGKHLIKKFPDFVTGEKIAHGSVCQPAYPTQMENREREVATHEEACARVAAQFSERWLRHYVRSKLRTDPVFPAAYQLLRGARVPLLDVGCGVGLLGFYLRERGFTAPIIGLDIDGPKIHQGRAAAFGQYDGIELRQQDVASEDPASFRGNVVVFDVLHYLAPSAQRDLLRSLSHCVMPGGSLLIRDAPRDRSARFYMTYAGEIFAQAVSWNIGTSLHFSTRAFIHAAFPEDEWTRAEQPAWGRTPFNNRLYEFRRRVGGASAAA